MSELSYEEKYVKAKDQLSRLGRVSVPNAAVLVGIHPQTMREYVKQDHILSIEIGARPWILKDEIERFKKEGKLQPQSSSDGNG